MAAVIVTKPKTTSVPKMKDRDLRRRADAWICGPQFRQTARLGGPLQVTLFRSMLCQVIWGRLAHANARIVSDSYFGSTAFDGTIRDSPYLYSIDLALMRDSPGLSQPAAKATHCTPRRRLNTQPSPLHPVFSHPTALAWAFINNISLPSNSLRGFIWNNSNRYATVKPGVRTSLREIQRRPAMGAVSILSIAK
jgi:hypothetical protein